jgi:hypothetical protein
MKIMAIKMRGEVTESNKDFEPIPNLEEGEYEGRLRYVADLGLHTNEWAGEKKPNVQKIALGIEIIGESVEIDGEQKPRLLWARPFNIFRTMTERGIELSMYKVFNPKAKDGEVANWDSVINEPCSVMVEHVNGKGENAGRVFDNIASLNSIPAKYKDDVGEGSITDGCTGDADDDENPAQAAMFGLPRWFHDNRLEEPEDLPF